MRLVDLVSQETGAAASEIMLLRHSTTILDKLLASGGSVEEYTHTQPTGSRYDFLADGKPPCHIVVVIVHDRVYGVYRVLGVEAEGTTYSLASDAHRRFDIERGFRDWPARRFRMERIPSVADNSLITGWERAPRSPTARSGGKTFGEVDVNLSDAVRLTEEIVGTGQLYEGSQSRVIVNAYERNPIARSRCVAHYGPMCVVCGLNFGAVYGSLFEGFIHVHHVKPLSEIGEEYEVDPIADLRPVCPNCHAVIHWGGGCRRIQDVKRLLVRNRRTKR
jgi:hypothetical protein